MDTDDNGLMICAGAAVLVLIVHWFIAALAAAIEKIRPRIKSLEEKETAFRHIARQLEKPQRLEFTFLAERSISSVITAFLIELVCWDSLLPFIRKIAGDYEFLPFIVLAAGFLLSAVIIALCNSTASRIGSQKAEELLRKSGRSTDILVVIMFPLQCIVRGLDWLFGGGKSDEEESAVTEEEFLLMVDAGNETGLIEESQKEMINNIIDFDDVMISNVMTHRKEIVGVDANMKISDVVYLAMNEGYSRMPVYEGSIDNIIGMLMVKDLLGLIGSEDISGYGVRHFMRAALFVPETAKCKYVLEDMLKDKAQMAVAVDEYGGTAGIVTMEDLLEEIVGNIRDEYDDEEIEVRETSTGVFTIEGTADPEETFEQLGLTLPEEQEFDTMSAWLVEQLGRIPDEDELPSVVYGSVRFTVLLIEDNWISRIKAETMEEE